MSRHYGADCRADAAAAADARLLSLSVGLRYMPCHCHATLIRRPPLLLADIYDIHMFSAAMITITNTPYVTVTTVIRQQCH